MYFGLFVVKLIECLTLFYGPGSTGASGGTVNSSSEDSSLSKGSTTAQFAYDGSGSDFEIMLEDNGVISICRLATFEPEPISDLEFGSSPVIQTVILKSEWLQDAFDEIDSSGDIIMFSISNSSPILKVMSLGLNGSTEIKYLNNDKLLDSFECIEEQESRFKLSLVMKCKSALNLSEKTKISINKNGFLLLQFKISHDTSSSFVSFVIAPQALE
ncbi:hypothetical protein BB558_000641 [Smittium angustum]|uniref:Uncharacterized protein n=1 Tax=Smittium angustum TaxID=133377 RepID=A0A2U1JDS4_SMIAN|nr:hypothetical protein BB558_000641 [Smittium angustum]